MFIKPGKQFRFIHDRYAQFSGTVQLAAGVFPGYDSKGFFGYTS